MPRPILAQGLDSVTDSNWNQHSLVHSLEQPINNIVHESTMIVKHGWRMSDSVLKLGLIWIGGWVAYSAAGEMFPGLIQEVDDIVGRAFKKARLG